MTAKQAKNLLPGTIVVWNGDKEDLGTVRQISGDGFYVDWENGQRGWIDFRDAKRIEIR